MTDEPKDPPKPAVVVSGQKRGACGCLITEFSDGTQDWQSCLACSLGQAGHFLQQASKRLMESAQANLEARLKSKGKL